MPDQITYRTDDATRWNLGKGADLTPAEIDINFWSVHVRLTDLEENPPEPVSITDIRQSGAQVYFEKSDGSETSPVTLLQAVHRTNYLEVTTATYTLSLADDGRWLDCTHIDGCVITVPTHDAVAFLKNAEIHVRQGVIGAPVSFVEADTGVSIDGMEGRLNALDKKGFVAVLKNIDGADSWQLAGGLAVDPDDTGTGT